MRIRSLTVDNFRAIRNVALDDLPDAVVIAGPNGCGKSSVLDAIRLLKSAYGQYQQNEYQQWFNEFKIDIAHLPTQVDRVLSDTTKPLLISAEFELAESERDYLKASYKSLIDKLFWSQATGDRLEGGERFRLTPTTKRINQKFLQDDAQLLKKEFGLAIRKKAFVAKLSMSPDGEVDIGPSPVLELIFSMYFPDHIGIIDYHGSNRNFIREQVGGINLSIEDPSERLSQNALYNTQNKYNNVKTQMAQSYVRQVLADRAGVSIPESEDLTKTLQELFALFFPGKEFLGPIPTSEGGLAFPVKLESGRTHDIDELSSGEKEVLLGYLRLRNSAPKNSILLIDEPELHLNPRLTRGLPRFYQKHLGVALGNQLWLITHSDALLREAVIEPSYKVFHMHPLHTVQPTEPQINLVSAAKDVERAVMDLAADLATYSPRSKVVLLEGGGDAEFDLSFVQRLFPEFADRVTLLSAGSKKRVGELHDLLDKASDVGKLGTRFYSIVDRDFDGPSKAAAERRFVWDVYHVENYLLEPEYIRHAIASLRLEGAIPTVSAIETMLKQCARETIESLVRMRLDRFVNETLVACIGKPDRQQANFSQALVAAANKSRSKIDDVLNSTLKEDTLRTKEKEIRKSLQNALSKNNWKAEFRGRDILKLLTDRAKVGVNYERFRNLIASRMAEAIYQPNGMKRVIDKILSA